MRCIALATSDEAFFSALSHDRSRELGVAEATRTWELYRAGVIRDMSWRVDRDDVVLVLEAEDPAAAEAVLSTPGPPALRRMTTPVRPRERSDHGRR
jgi:hypothetical protein